MNAVVTPSGYTPAEAGEVLRCSADQVRALITAGRLGAVNVGLGRRRARWIISQASIEAFLTPPVNQKPSRRRQPPATSKRWI